MDKTCEIKYLQKCATEKYKYVQISSYVNKQYILGIETYVKTKVKVQWKFVKMMSLEGKDDNVFLNLHRCSLHHSHFYIYNKQNT